MIELILFMAVPLAVGIVTGWWACAAASMALEPKQKRKRG